MKLFNAFSIQMVATPCNVAFEEISNVEELKRDLAGTPIESFIGHADTANVASNLLGINVPYNRAFGKLENGETAIVIQVVGGRLPEGCTTLPEGMKMKFIRVTVK